MLEKSSAVKCPNLPSQLVGAKKVQQYLCEEGVLERFVLIQYLGLNWC